MAELLRNMAADPNARIVLNGCLTASNSVNTPLDADPATAAAQVQGAINAEPSLATHLGAAAAAAGNRAQVRGANASFGQVGLMDPSGNLDIVPGARAPDPLLTAAKVLHPWRQRAAGLPARGARGVGAGPARQPGHDGGARRRPRAVGGAHSDGVGPADHPHALRDRRGQLRQRGADPPAR